MLGAILREIELRADFIEEGSLETLYFGGGTPSVLAPGEISLILDKLSKYYEWDSSLEFTLEANPEDLTSSYTKELAQLGVNRLSIGIQSLNQQDLTYMNRSHTSDQAFIAVENARDAGISLICADLMFGLINRSADDWKSNVEGLISLRPDHISCYNLTIEEQTAFHHWKKNDRLAETSETIQHEQFFMGAKLLQDAGYDHYEISNFALNECYSRHNSAYWSGHSYIGFGPSAHSFNGISREWNVANNATYIKSILSGEVPNRREDLNTHDIYNETVMLGFRTKWGFDIEKIKAFPESIQRHFRKVLDEHIKKGRVLCNQHTCSLAYNYWYLSDDIISDFFIV
jgi:oxygen-independent coproporphyrinogen-3 oxidase